MNRASGKRAAVAGVGGADRRVPDPRRMSDEEVGGRSASDAPGRAMTLEVQRRAALILREGISATEARRFIDQAYWAVAASGDSFCIVPCGRPRAIPHGLPGECSLAEGDVVLIEHRVRGRRLQQRHHTDLCVRRGRSGPAAHLGDRARGATGRVRRSPDRSLCEPIDQAARRVLVNAGPGRDYRLPGLPHRTGHGSGLCIHEVLIWCAAIRPCWRPACASRTSPCRHAVPVRGAAGGRFSRHGGGRGLVY